ncbi:hypothetical protein SCUP234_01099 [Seiridium cupressi]
MERRAGQRRTATGTDANERAKSFLCSHPGCGKRFSRLEHQRRHEYNHGVGDATCPRCSAHFKRPDLLERHLNRHRQKDEEAGGEGYGILNTRKRAWKAPDGSVVPKKPSVTAQQTSHNQPSRQNQSDIVSSGQENNAGIPISPPASTGHSDHGQFQEFPHEQHDDSNLLLGGNSWSSGIGSIEESNADVQENFWVDPGLLPPAIPASQQFALPYDDIFQPDTASSFNMPYTTAANYHWLFEQNNTIFDTLADQCAMDIDSGFQTTIPSQEFQSMGMEPMVPNHEHSAPTKLSCDSIQNQGAGYPQVISPASKIQAPARSAERSSNTTASNVSGRNTESVVSQTNHATPAQLSHKPPPSSELERPLSTLRPPSRLPVIHDDARDRLLEIIDVAQPAVPSGSFSAWDHDLLSLGALQDYLDLFFTKFNTTYPLIHCATFDADRTEPLLLLSVLLLGATYSNRDAHQLAVCIHDVVRPQIFAHAGFSAKPELWVLQTILLVECFGKSRAGQKQHDMSHLFHGLLINLIRRSDCQTVQTAPFRKPPAGKDNAEVYWRQWAEAEEKKRLALLCFMWDTQHAVLFCQSLCMSAFELRLSMPCSQALWEANDDTRWREIQNAESQPEISYLTALKSYLFNPGSQRPAQLNALSRVLVLHGLMSISWDLERRDQTALGVVSFVGGVNWRNRLGDAYDLWKTDFDSYCSEYVIKQRQLSQAPGNESVDWNTARREFATFTTAYNSIYRAAHILLNSSFLDVQIYAGSRHILGRPIRRGDYIRSEKIVRRWTSGSDGADLAPSFDSPRPGNPAEEPVSTSAAVAAHHAACMLREASTHLDDFDSMGIFHVPWCFYLATLTVWAFQHARPSRWNGNEDESSEMVWDARKEMDELLSSMTGPKLWKLGSTQGRGSTAGLCFYMSEVLGRVRWGIVHAGTLVLKALIPMRLVGQYEGL